MKTGEKCKVIKKALQRYYSEVRVWKGSGSTAEWIFIEVQITVHVPEQKIIDRVETLAAEALATFGEKFARYTDKEGSVLECVQVSVRR